MPTIREHKTAIVTEWTLDEVAHAFEIPVHPNNRGEVEKQVTDEVRGMAQNRSWYGGLTSVDQAKSLLVDGWHDGVNRLESLCADLNPPAAQTRKRKPCWRDDGDDLNIERAMRGEWDTAWRSSRRVWTQGPQTIELYSIYGGSASLSAEEIFWNGAACVVLADRLEAAGYAVRIVACFMHRGDGRYTRHDVISKEAHEPRRIDGVASIMCHAGIYRTFLFRTWAVSPIKLTPGLGPAVYSFSPHVINAFQKAGERPEGALVVDQAYSREACVRRIDELMAKATQ